MKSLFNKTLDFFFRMFCFAYILDLDKTVWALPILSQMFTRNCTCEYVILLQSFHRGTFSIHWYIATRFAEFIQFRQDPNCSRNIIFWRKNLVFHWRKILYFVFIYIFPLVLLFIYLFQINNLKLARWFLLTLKH